MAKSIDIDLNLGGVFEAVRGFQGFAGAFGAFGGGSNVSLAGLGPLAKLGLVAGTAAASLALVAKAADTAAENLTQFAHLRDTLGSTSGETAQLRLLGQVLGINVGSAAASLHAAAISGGLGTATAARYGVSIRPVEVGSPTDRGADLLKVMEGLWQTARSQGSGQALVDARNLHQEDLFGVTYLSREQLDRVKELAQATSALYGPEQITQAYELKFAMAELSIAWTDLTTVIGTRVIPAVADVIKFFADGIRSLTGASSGTGAASNPTVQSLQELNRTMQQNNEALRYMAGIYGGGSAARSAIPQAFGPQNGMFLSQALGQHALRLGLPMANW
jgi:hypothetical protein